MTADPPLGESGVSPAWRGPFALASGNATGRCPLGPLAARQGVLQRGDRLRAADAVGGEAVGLLEVRHGRRRRGAVLAVDRSREKPRWASARCSTLTSGPVSPGFSTFVGAAGPVGRRRRRRRGRGRMADREEGRRPLRAARAEDAADREADHEQDEEHRRPRRSRPRGSPRCYSRCAASWRAPRRTRRASRRAPRAPWTPSRGARGPPPPRRARRTSRRDPGRSGRRSRPLQGNVPRRGPIVEGGYTIEAP